MTQRPVVAKKGSFNSQMKGEELEKETSYLRGLGLPDDEVVSESHPCSLILSALSKPAGKLYLTKNYICFVGTNKSILVGATVINWHVRDVLDISPLHRTSIKITGLGHAKSATIGGFSGGEDSRNKLLRTLKRLLYGINGGNALHKAVIDGDMETVRNICKRDVTKLTEYNSNDQSPLILACITDSDDELVDFLLEVYRNNPQLDINQTDERGGLHVLHEACKSSDISDEVLKKLLEFPGIKVNSKVKIDNNTPLHYFCERNHSLNCKHILKLFIEKGADVNSQNTQHETPLHRAILNTSVRKFMVEFLIEHKASVDIRAGNGGDTPLHYAVRVGSLDILKILLKAGADITLKNKDNDDPISLASTCSASCASGYDELVEFLNDITTLHAILRRADTPDFLPKFVSNGFYGAELAKLNDDLLRTEIGIEKIGPRLKIAREIQEYIKQTELEKPVQNTSKPPPLPPPGESEQPLDDELKQQLGDVSEYEIDEKELEYLDMLGTGASSQVFLGLFGKDKKKVAIKVLNQQTNRIEEFQDFKKEFQILISVHSEYIIKFYGCTFQPRLCMVMEYAERGSLYSVMKTPGVKLSWDRLLSFTYDAAKGMETLHTHDPPVVHRDLKSLNLLVTGNWRVKVCDFGLSRPDSPEQLMTLFKLCGTCAYCAPEMFNGKKTTAKSDIYSLGIVIWEMLTTAMTGAYQVPFSEFDIQHQFQILVEASKGVHPTVPNGSPIDIVQLYKDCVNIEPDFRPSSTDIAKRVLKIQATYKENPSEWANTKAPRDSDRTIVREKTARDSPKEEHSDNGKHKSRDETVHGDSRSSFDSSRSIEQLSKSRETDNISNSKRNGHKRGSSQPVVSPHTSDRMRLDKKNRKDYPTDSSGSEDDSSIDSSSGCSGGSGDSADDEVSKKKTKTLHGSSKTRLKKGKKSAADDKEDFVGSNHYISNSSSSGEVSKISKSKKDKEKEKEKEKEKDSDADKIISPRRKTEEKTRKNTKAKKHDE